MGVRIDEGEPDDGDLRCCCGRLLAVRTAAGYEIRCSRCKTVQVLPRIAADDEETTP